jgi:ABC-2 type transport system ATP-binding protein
MSITLSRPEEAPEAPETPPDPASSAESLPLSEVILRCTDLHKKFGERKAVDGVSFEIGRGETYGLLGPNGAGKTTTISMVCGILARDGGEVAIGGRSLDPSTTALKGEIGYVPQDLAIYPDLSARENLVFFGRLYGLGDRALGTRVAEILALIDLADRAGEQTSQFSGGMKRRLNIGIGLLHRPRLLVLDEPTVGVDPQSRNAILTSVEALAAEGMAILYTTHYMEEAERLCHRVGIIDQGKIIAEGTRRELVALVGGLDKVTLAASGDVRAGAAAAEQLAGVRTATPHDGGIDLLVVEARQLLPRLLEVVSRDGIALKSVEVVEPDLEAVFLHLTGKALRD